MRLTAIVAVLALAALAAGCSMTTKAADFNGLTTPDGKATHLNTTNYAVHFLFSKPVLGDATLPTTVADCTREAKAIGATKMRLVQSGSHAYWWVLPPISFVVQPVVTNVAGDAIQ